MWFPLIFRDEEKVIENINDKDLGSKFKPRQLQQTVLLKYVLYEGIFKLLRKFYRLGCFFWFTCTRKLANAIQNHSENIVLLVFSTLHYFELKQNPQSRISRKL